MYRWRVRLGGRARSLRSVVVGPNGPVLKLEYLAEKDAAQSFMEVFGGIRNYEEREGCE